MAWSLRIERASAWRGVAGPRKLMLRTPRRVLAATFYNEWAQLRHRCNWWTWTLVRVWAEKASYCGDGVWEGGVTLLGVGVFLSLWPNEKEDGDVR